MPGDFPCVSPSLSPHWLGATAGRGVGADMWAGAGSWSPTEVGTVILLSGNGWGIVGVGSEVRR